MKANVLKQDQGKRPHAHKYEWQARAMMLVYEHFDWPGAKIAREVRVHLGTLSRSEYYRQAASMARGREEENRPGGEVYINPETGLRDVEVVCYKDDPAKMNCGEWLQPACLTGNVGRRSATRNNQVHKFL